MSLPFLVPGLRLADDIELLAELSRPGDDFWWRARRLDGSVALLRVVEHGSSQGSIDRRMLTTVSSLRHPAIDPIVRFYDVPVRGVLVVESELPEATAGERLRLRGAFPPHDVAECISQVAVGIDYLNEPCHLWHGNEVALFHRNLHPDALALFRQDGALRWRVGDFALAKPSTTAEAPNSRSLGRYQYDAPELYEGVVSGSSDQYSLAIIYVELRTGLPPFYGTMLEQLQQRLKEQPRLTGLSSAEEAIVRRALARDPRERFPSCVDFASRIVTSLAAASTSKLPARTSSKAQAPSIGPAVASLPRLSSASSALAAAPAGSSARLSRAAPLNFPEDRIAWPMVAACCVALVGLLAFLFVVWQRAG
jgi:serine/threonine protein kinase